MKNKIIGVVASVVAIISVGIPISMLKGQGDKRPSSSRTSVAVTAEVSDVDRQDPVQTAPEMEVVKPGTPDADKLAKLKEMNRLGLVKVQNLGGNGPWSTLQPPPPYRGSIIAPTPDTKGNVHPLHAAFSNLFKRLDPQPISRSEHFRWLPNIEGLQQIGWYGTVVGAQPQPDSSVLVKIRIKPYLYHSYIHTLLLDYVDETYRAFDGRIELIDSDAAVERPELQVFPIH